MAARFGFRLGWRKLPVGGTTVVVCALLIFAGCLQPSGPGEDPLVKILAVSGSGSGNVSSSGASLFIDCIVTPSGRSGTCESFASSAPIDAMFVLTAVPQSGSLLTELSASCVPSDSCSTHRDSNQVTLAIIGDPQPADEDQRVFTVTVGFDLDPSPPSLPPADGDVVLFDDFDDPAGADTRWLAEAVATDPLITHTAEHRATGGFPDGYRHMTHDWQAPGTITVRHFYQERTFDPGAAGDCEISHLDYNEDRVRLLPVSSSGAIGANLIIRQDGQLFSFTGGTTFSLNEWERLSLDGLTPGDFTPSPGPDFTAAGGPMEFGYSRANTTGSSVHHNEHGTDNWRVEIHCTP